MGGPPGNEEAGPRHPPTPVLLTLSMVLLLLLLLLWFMSTIWVHEFGLCVVTCPSLGLRRSSSLTILRPCDEPEFGFEDSLFRSSSPQIDLELGTFSDILFFDFMKFTKHQKNTSTGDK
jgi:hypothetical protein